MARKAPHYRYYTGKIWSIKFYRCHEYKLRQCSEADLRVKWRIHRRIQWQFTVRTLEYNLEYIVDYSVWNSVEYIFKYKQLPTACTQGEAPGIAPKEKVPAVNFRA